MSTPNARTAHVAVVMLDTRVSGSYVPRETWRKVPVPIAVTAARVAARLTEAVGETITGEEVRAAHALLRSAMPTHELRQLAESPAVEPDWTYAERAAFHREQAAAARRNADGATGFERTKALDVAQQHERAAERFESYAKQQDA